MRALFPGWYVILGAGIGIGFGSLPLFASGFGLLAAAMAKDFGWSQPDVAKAATIFLLVQTVVYPLCGWPLDRWGSKKFAVVNILAFAAALALLSTTNGSLTQFYLIFALVGFFGAGTNVVAYARAVALWFNRRRGLALGLAASGQAFGSFLVPILAQKTIAAYGWSTALLLMAACEALICMPLVAFLVKDSPVPYGHRPDGDPAPLASETANEEPGMSVGEIVRTTTFWKLAISFAVMGMSFYAIAPNVVYILTKTAGLSLAEVAAVQAASGIAVLFGRVGFGLLLDRIHAPLVGVAALALFCVCCLIYATAPAHALVILGGIIGGLSIGGETDLMPFLASRYFGTRSVSRIFGWFLFAFFAGAAIGPIAFAQLMVSFEGARTPLFLLVAVQIVPALLFLSLDRYPKTHAAPVAGIPTVS